VKQGDDAVKAVGKQASALERIGTMEEVVSVVLFLMSDAASYVSGSVVEVDGGAK
jgi:NAD(P)-dependent dehydrogenase (short-subunit alcohol dehydrogenase family)